MTATPAARPVPSASADPPRPAQARVLAGAVIGLVGGFTTVYFSTLGQFVVPITQEFGWGRAELSAVTVLALLGSALAAPAAGRIAQRRGSRPVVAVSGLALAAGFVALAATPASPPYLALLSLLIGAAAVGTTAAGHLVNVPRFFERRLGLALGVATAGGGLGASALQLVTGAVIADLGWRQAYLVLAAVALVCAVGSVLVGFPAGTGPTPGGSAGPEAGGPGPEGLGVREVLRSWRFVVAIAALFAVAAAALGFSVHIVAFMIDRGVPPVAATSVAAVGALGVTAGRLVSGALLDRLPAPRVGAVVFTVAALGFVVPAAVTDVPVVVYALAAVAGGFALGTEGDLIPFIVRRYAGPAFYPAVLGLLFGAYTLGGALGPVLFGLSYDGLGSYVPALWIGAVVLVLGGAGLQVLGPYRYAARG